MIGINNISPAKFLFLCKNLYSWRTILISPEKNMARTSLQGTFTALVTPFTRHGEIDYQALTTLIDRQLEAAVDGLVIFGTSGESPTISAHEYQQVIRFAVERSAQRTQIIAGVGSNNTESSVSAAQTAMACGADALLVVCPYYNKPSQEGIHRHFSRIADSVALPQLVYNIAGRTGVNIETDTLLRLSRHENIVGVKEASDDIHQITDVIRQTPEDFVVLAGSDHMTFALLALGGDGVIAVLANLLPHAMRELVDSALSGDLIRAREQHYRLLPLMRGCMLESNPIPIKTALAWRGDLEEAFRLPLCPMQDERRNRWRQLLVEHNVL
jgi:4-hydroxy-tetrahydrodipicolinate synthase